MIKTEKILFRDKSRKNSYYTILNDKIYFQNHLKERSYVYDFNTHKTHRILEKSCATHNFTPFLHNGKYFAIGGQDSWKHDPKWRNVDYKTFKKTFEDHFKKEYRRGEEFYKEIKYKFDTTPVWNHNKGLYLFCSKDGIGWKEVYKTPIITVKSDGFKDALLWKSTDFDSRPSIIFFKGLYYIYVRANVSKNMRKIQYTTTKDFMNFSKFQLINTENGDNEYLISTFAYSRKIFAFIPAFNEYESFINLYVSKDGRNFQFCNKYFQSLPARADQNKAKNKCHSCEGISEKENDIFFYIHHNYNGHNESHDVNVMEYSMSKKYLKAL